MYGAMYVHHFRTYVYWRTAQADTAALHLHQLAALVRHPTTQQQGSSIWGPVLAAMTTEITGSVSCHDGSTAQLYLCF